MSFEKTNSPLLRQCFVTAAVCINLVGNGCAFGFPAVLLPQTQNPDSSLQLNKNEQSWIASVISITILFGNFSMPLIMGRLGRRIGHFVVLLFIVAGWVMIVFSQNFVQLLIGRILQGLSFGLLVPLRSVLIGEYTSPKYRGAFLAVISFAQAFGIFFVHLAGSLLNWRQTALITLLFPITSFIMTCLIPESPSWLADKGKYDKCRQSFRWLRGDEESRELEELIRARMEFKESNLGKRNIKQLAVIVKRKEFYKPIVLMMHLSLLMYVAGSVTIAMFPTQLIKLIMGPTVDVNFWMVALDSQRIISNAIAIFVIHRVRRRTMMFFTGGLSVATHLAIIQYTYARNHGHLAYDIVWIPVLLLNIQIFTMAVGMVPLPNVIAGEIFPLEYRSAGGSISTGLVSGVVFVLVQTFPYLVDNVGIHGTYAVYTGLLAYGLSVIWFLLPETKGRTLQEIEDGYKGIKKSLDDDVTEKLNVERSIEKVKKLVPTP